MAIKTIHWVKIVFCAAMSSRTLFIIILSVTYTDYVVGQVFPCHTPNTISILYYYYVLQCTFRMTVGVTDDERVQYVEREINQ